MDTSLVDATPWTWLWLTVLVVGLAVTVLGLVLLRRTGPASPQDAAAPRTGAQDVLAERLAAGEIDVAEYERRRAVLDER